jgi:hypothetical protein
MPAETLHDLIVIEYEQLKAEQRERIGLRDNLIYVTLAAYAAVSVAALTVQGQAHLLLVLPFAATLLGWTHLVNDERISEIGRYVRSGLAPRLEAVHPDTAPAFAWEHTHRNDQRRNSRKRIQLAIDLATFNVPALFALALYWVGRPLNGPLLLVSAVEIVATGVLAWQRITHADLSG